MTWNHNPVLTVSEMYEADNLAIKSGVSGVQLMASAGEAVAKAVGDVIAAGKVLVLCGPGNNGGDGFVAARVLEKKGFKITLFSLVLLEEIKGDAQVHARQWGGEIRTHLDEKDFEDADVIVDALFGAGLSRSLEGDVIKYSRWSQTRPVVSVDIPSGVSGDTGEVLGEHAFKAAATVTFFLKKPGHLLYPGKDLCGQLFVADIGIKQSCLKKISPKIAENNPSLWEARIPRYEYDKHKYDFGHSLIFGGEMTGAARLSCLAALRVGSGLVSIACPDEDRLVYALTSPSLIVRTMSDQKDLEAILSDERINSVLVGPGAGRDEALKSKIQNILEKKSRPIVLDADAISVFELCPNDLIQSIHENTVLTPHEGEFKRLFPDLIQSRIENATEAAERSGGVIVLKGADTVVASADGRVVVNNNAPGWLARGGTGDVLAGIITGLLAQRMDPFDAACAGVWIHSAAARLAGAGMIADDLLDSVRVAIEQIRSE